MEEVMICLVGEQPLPNLLPVRYDEPKHVVLAYTKSTEQVSNRLKRVFHGEALVYPLEVLPFDIPAIRHVLEDSIKGRGWKPEQIVFNLTGGTKAMAFAAYSLAEAWRSRFIYLEGEAATSRLYRYRFDQVGAALPDSQDIIPGVITLDNYFLVHLGDYIVRGAAKTEGGRFEEAIGCALEPPVDEVAVGVIAGGALEIDLALRCANQVGIAQAKVGTISGAAINHLNTAGRREFLGTYTQKLLVVGTPVDHTRSNLKELAEASAIALIELSGYDRQTGDLPDRDRERLVREVAETLGCW